MQQVATAPVEAAARGGALGFEDLYRTCRDDVYAYVAGLLRDRHAAEDVTALAFERAYRRRRRFDPRRGSGRAWIFGIARNAALDELRRRKRSAPLLGEPEDPGVADSGDDADLALQRAALRSALAALELRDRELIALRFFAGLSQAEIGAVLAISPSAAGTRLSRAVEKLRKGMQ